MSRLQFDGKKLISSGRRDSLTGGRKNFDADDWNDWLKVISKFFSCYTVSSIRENTSDHSRPYVTVNIEGVPMLGLLDTGSSISVLGNNSHNQITTPCSKVSSCDHINFIAAGGQQLKPLGTMELPITFKNQSHVLQMYVVPEIQNSLILGMDFWRAFDLFPKHLHAVELVDRGVISANLDVATPNHVCSYNHLSNEQRKRADDIIAQFREISYEERGLGRTSLTSHVIDTGNAAPIRQRYYRMSPEKQQILISELDKMLKEDVVEPCESPWSSPVLLTPKKNGELRFCLDSRKLNAVTKKDAYSLPYILDILDNLRDAKYLTSLDLSKSFWQILIREEDRCKTAFYVPTRGTFQFKSMAFGLTNASATQQRLVDALFYGPEFEHLVFVFVDDIIIISPTFEKHITLLKRVFEKLKSANLTINFKKSQFFREQLNYLGYVVDADGLHADPTKIEAIMNFPTPTNRKEVRRFLGTASWYRRFIANFSSLAAPLNKLTSQAKSAPPFKWTLEADNAFKKLKHCLVSPPVLSCPDYSKPFEVHTDASDFGIGAVLTQNLDGKENVIAYMSKSLSNQERNYSATEREALAVLTAIEHWRCYLENGQTFLVYTDHASLKWFLNLNNPTGRLARWGVRLSAYNFIIKHRRGADNVVADSLSRSVPITAISTDSNNILQTNDPWYLNIYNGCTKSPSSFLNYRIQNNKLYRYVKSLNALTREFEWKEVVPAENRDELLQKNHSEPTSGHFGIFKTYKRIHLNYFWPGMYHSVAKFVSNCDICTSHKYPTHPTLGNMGRPKECSRPFQVLSMDLIGPLPVTRKQNTFILVITCCFSKYCSLFPIRRATAEIITRILEENIFLIHGIPSTIYMDNGKQFTSNILKNLLNHYKIPNIRFTPKYTPQVNTVERYNKTIMVAVSSYIENDHRLWDVNLPKIQFAMNSSVNEVTGFTPSFLVFGRELVSCGSHYTDTDQIDDAIFSPRDEYAENLGVLKKIFDKVQLSLLKSHSRNSTTYNLRRKNVEFNVGDIVWKRTYYLSDKDNRFAKKLAPKFVKCRVVTKKSPLIYDLEDLNGCHLGTWHIKDLKLKHHKD